MTETTINYLRRCADRKLLEASLTPAQCREIVQMHADLQAERDELLDALRALMQMDVRGHTLEHRLQFSDAGRDLLGMAGAAIARAEGGDE